MKLHHLKPADGAKKERKRVGRGRAGVRGKTAGRGTKGTGARKNVPAWFEGGQMPLQRRLPKRGFKSQNLKFNGEVTLGDLQKLGKAEVDLLALKEAKLVAQIVQNVKVIKSGELTTAVKLTGIGATAGAKAAIEAAGGSLN